jgi:microsomal prostaglandin-E synthase 2
VCALAGARAVHSSAFAAGAAASASPSSSSPSSLPFVELPTSTPVSVVLYQYESCPFCNKLRAYLDYARIPYVVVEVDPLFKGQLAWSKDYKKVPLAVVNGQVVTDSSAIIDTLDALVGRSAGGAASTTAPVAGGVGLAWPRAAGQGSEEEAKWRRWVDDTLVHVLTANIYRTPSESLQSFDYLTQRNFPAWSAALSKGFGAPAMYFVAKRVKSKHNITGDEREALRAAAAEWTAAVGDARPFLGGSAPNLADLAVFGVVRAVVKGELDTARDLFASSPAMEGWYRKVEGVVGKPSLMHRIGEAPERV